MATITPELVSNFIAEGEKHAGTCLLLDHDTDRVIISWPCEVNPNRDLIMGWPEFERDWLTRYWGSEEGKLDRMANTLDRWLHEATS